MLSINLLLLFVIITTTNVVHIASLSQRIVIKNEAQIPQKVDSALDIILVSAPAAGHLIPLSRLGQELAYRGHRVSLCTTVVVGWNFSQEVAMHHNISFISAGLDPRNRSEYSALTNALRELSVYHSLLKAQLVLAQSENIIKKFLDQPSFNHWNIAVFDFILESSGISLAQKWNVPIVVNSPGLAYSPLLLPEWPFPVIGSGSNDKMHLTQRLYNSIFLIPTAYSLKVVLIVCNKVITGWSNSPTISSSLFSGAGVNYPLLINTVIGFDYSRFHSPVTHYTGPLLCRTGDITNEIPPDIAEWLESEATLDVFRGVVLISMGSTAHLTSSMIKTILNSLQTCNYSAIWSIGSTDKNLFKSALTAMPKARVKVVTWIPQSLLLQHPSVKFAILHGGINGLQEAIHNRIPIICLPQMFDQYENANRIVHNNLGLSIDPVTMNTDDLTHVVHLITYQYMFFKQSVIKLALLYDKGGGVKEAANIIEYYESVGISWIKEHNTGGLIYTVFLFTASVCLSLFFIFIFLTCYN